MPDIPPPQVFFHPGAVTRADRAALLRQTGATIWFTGLSGSGKSTVAAAVEKALVRHGHAAYVLDGDNVRLGLNASPKILTDTRGYDPDAAERFGLGFRPADRVENVRRVGEVAKLFADAGLIALTSFISPYRADRDAARAAHAAAAIPFVEVYVSTPIETCERRDPKGLYRQAREALAAGKTAGFTGIDDPYEPPASSELTLNTATQPVAECVAAVVTYLAARGVIRE